MSTTQLTLAFPILDAPIVCPHSTVPIDTTFPEQEANKLAEIESFNKHLFRPNTYLHKWWARRSGSTFRYILKQLVPDASKRDYYSSGGLEGITVLDPMIGGGTILHEAIRLGANVIGYDIDPIPVLQAKASLSSIPISDKEEVYCAFERELAKRITKYYRTSCPICQCLADIQFTLYGLRKLNGNSEVIVVDSFVLREESDGTHRNLDEFYPSRNVSIGNHAWPIIDKEEARVLGINGKTSDILSASFTERYVPLIIAGYCPIHHSFFKQLDSQDVKLIMSADRWARKNIQHSRTNFVIPSGPKSSDLTSRNVHHFFELFFPRQLIYIAQSQAILATMPHEHVLWLSLLLSTSLEFNAALCGYKGCEKRRPGAIRHVFSHHAYSFPYTSLENNPVFFRRTSGTLGSLFDSRIVTAGHWAGAPIERRSTKSGWVKTTISNEIDMGQEVSSLDEFIGRKRMFIATQNDSTHMPLPSESVDFIVTDPPYFDSVQYSDLSHFFRCWLKTFLPDEADWQYATQSSAVAESSCSEQKFGAIIGRIWCECNRLLARPHGRLIFTYHHWNASAWAQLSIALQQANFILVNAFVVHSENPISVHIMNLRALTHDTILVLRPSGSSEPVRWHRPKAITSFDSYSFCKACGQMMGWVLQNGLSQEEIRQTWSVFLKGSSDG